MKKFIPVILILIIAFESCKVGPDYQAPEYNVPASYINDSSAVDSIVALKWWEVFNDPNLDTLIRIGLVENKDLLIAAANIEAAMANVGFKKADQWPSFNYGASVGGEGAQGGSGGSFIAYPQMAWEIDFWGKYSRSTESARASLMASVYAQKTVELTLVSSIATTYFNLLTFHAQLNLAERTFKTRNAGYEIMKSKYEGGLISQMDLNQAKIQRDLAAISIPRYKRSIALTENTLSLLLGRNPFKVAVDSSSFEYHDKLVIDIPAGLPSQLLQRRPDVLMSEQLYRSQFEQIGISEALRYPSISLTALFGAASNDLSSLNSAGLVWSASTNILGPIFQFGKNKRRVEIAEFNAKSSLISYEKTALTAFKEVEDALVGIGTYKDEIEFQKSRAETAVSSEELSKIRYSEGTTTYLEVLEQERQSFSGQLDLLSNRLNLINSYIALYKALGGGWEE